MNKLWAFILFALLFSACTSGDFMPKPKAYPRIDLPENQYQSYQSDCPFIFDYNEISSISYPKESKQLCWLNVDYPRLNCRLHLSYKEVEGNLEKLKEDSRTMVYKHTIKASAINEFEIIDSSHQVFAHVYELEGNAASSVQFYASNGANHFLRGALYFNSKTNADSLKPAILYVRQDVDRLIASLRWK